MIRHAPEAAPFPVGSLPVAVIEPSFPALLVPPVGTPPLLASHPAAALIPAVDLAPDSRNGRCKTSPRNPILGKTTAATPLLWPRPARFHSRLRTVGCGRRRWGDRLKIRERERMGGTDWEEV